MMIDFLIGVFAANALPHFVLGCVDAQVLGLFGYGARQNRLYGYFCAAVALLLFHVRYGLSTLLAQPMLLGVLFVVFSYFLGWPVIDRFLRRKAVPAHDER